MNSCWLRKRVLKFLSVPVPEALFGSFFIADSLSEFKSFPQKLEGVPSEQAGIDDFIFLMFLG